MPQHQNDENGDVITQVRPEVKTKKPRMYRVLIHNDHYTHRDFVVWILQTVFQKSTNDAVAIMLHVHTSGVGVAGIYTREVAESKAAKSERLARAQEHPLQLSVEPDDSGGD